MAALGCFYHSTTNGLVLWAEFSRFPNPRLAQREFKKQKPKKKDWLHSLYPQHDPWRPVFTCGLAPSGGVKHSGPRVPGRRFAYNLSRRRTTLEG